MFENENAYNPIIAEQGTTFISKVFLFFGLAILMSTGGAVLGMYYLMPFFLASPVLMYLLFAVELGLVFTSRMWSEKHPINYLLFSLFALITGITLIPVLALAMVEAQGATMIIKALFATTLMFGATAIFGYTTNFNLSGLRGFLTFSIIGLIIVSIIGIFIPWSNTFEMGFSAFGVILFGAYTMYDIQQIKNSQGLMNPLDAALRLYLDIFNLFIFILRLMLSLSRD